MIVAQTGCPVVPAYLKGTFDVLPAGANWPRFQSRVRFIGDSLTFTRNGENEETKRFIRK